MAAAQDGHVCLHSNNDDNNYTPYESRQDMLPLACSNWCLSAPHNTVATVLRYAVQVTLQTYRIIPPVLSGVFYNVRIQLESSSGHASFYCNPSWGGQPDETNTIAQPQNAVWETGMVVPNAALMV